MTYVQHARLLQATIFCALFGVVATASAALDALFSKDVVVAKMATTELKGASLLRTISSQNPDTRKALKEQAEALSTLAKTEVLRQALLAKARADQLERRPDVVALMERAAEQALLERYLDIKSAPPSNYPTKHDIETAYQENKNAFTIPPAVKVAQILIRVAPDAPKMDADRAERKAKEVYTRAGVPGADFGILAKMFSDDKESNTKGGVVGWLEVPKLLPEVRTTISELAIDVVSKPVRTKFGWQIFKVLERRDAVLRPLADVTPALVIVLRKQRAEENRKALIKEQQDMGITVDEAALDEVRKKIE